MCNILQFTRIYGFNYPQCTEAERGNPPQSDTIADVIADTVADIIADAFADVIADDYVDNGKFQEIFTLHLKGIFYTSVGAYLPLCLKLYGMGRKFCNKSPLKEGTVPKKTISY